jgi:hypothetical protein
MVCPWTAFQKGKVGCVIRPAGKFEKQIIFPRTSGRVLKLATTDFQLHHMANPGNPARR